MQIGENSQVVSERFGHSRVGITLDLYSHVSDDLHELAQRNLGKHYSRGETLHHFKKINVQD